MELIYEGRNITDNVVISSAESRDEARDRSDSMELLLENPSAWFRWEPKQGDRLEIRQDGYSTGEMFLSAIAPENGKFRILATAAKPGARIKRNQSFENKSLQNIGAICAGVCGMDWRLYGISAGIYYQYLLQSGETCPAFLNRVAALEGAVLKTYAGRFTMIGIEAAQALPAAETITITAGQDGTYYERKEKWRTITVQTPYARAFATDDMVDANTAAAISLPAMNAETAGRWARGLLIAKNRQAEKLTLETEFHGAWSAMIRVDIAGNTEASGKWVIDRVEHDFIRKTSRAQLLRCVETVR